ncbi:hypothetical protein [Flavobacterium phycosphaerae]|uniref:hypothetical protein n=1 Tax=Flavobacterium phycosphaerae TaxID=2697515 RepID=UPI00138B0A49|nr:hypothetical protein [Flavobacterium phycosphaerae]
MKTKILSLSILSLMSITSVFAQDRTTVTANNSEISDNLDLRAVASIFGDSENLADFERRLNDPKTQISNLDLNEDNQVDYLRVIETVEGNAHLIVIQSVLGRDTYQDVATVEVQKDRNNQVQVQVVGDVYMYGANYIYEPVYVSTPIIYASFWIGNYRPYYSTWYWGYYPTYYYTWNPYPIFRYRSHIGICINNYHHYNYVNYRRCETAYNSYRGRRGNAYETRYPDRSFGHRNTSYANRYELDKTRNIRTVGTRNELAVNTPRGNANNGAITRGNGTKKNDSPRNPSQRGNTRDNSSVNESPRTNPRSDAPRSLESNGNATPRNYGQNGNSPRGNNGIAESPRAIRTQEASPRVFSNQRNETTNASAPRGNNRSYESPRSSAPQRENNRSYSPQGNSAPREISSQRGNSGGGNQGSARGNGGGNRRG